MERKIVLYGSYFSEFYNNQNNKVKDKIDYVLDLVRFESRVPKKFLKYLSGTVGLYEIKIITVKNIRIFCCFDEGQLIVLTNCFVKKSQKTPKSQLELAIKLKKEYFNNKTSK